MMSSEKRGIVEFFLNIFKLQMNLPGRAGQYRMISEEDAAADQIFELRVKGEDQWISRRMTISPLGEESGSKSKCFKVIYDDMIVIKMPPSPITDFAKICRIDPGGAQDRSASRTRYPVRDAQPVRHPAQDSAILQ